jgi:hypothetical protein
LASLTQAALSSTTTPAGKALSNSDRRSESASLASYCRRSSPLATASSAVSDSTRPCSPWYDCVRASETWLKTSKARCSSCALLHGPGICTTCSSDGKSRAINSYNSRAIIIFFSLFACLIAGFHRITSMAAAGTETTETAGAGNPLDRAREALARLSNKQKVVLMVSIAAVIALLVVAGYPAQAKRVQVLFSNIGERDGGAIIAALEQMNIPYKFSDSGSAILVPDSSVHDVRLRLASQGLPRGGAVGFELMEARSSASASLPNRSIISAVWKASCREPSSRSRRFRRRACTWRSRSRASSCARSMKPSASVMLNLYPGRSLDATQIAGIQNLVAASVPQLAPPASPCSTRAARCCRR